MCVFSFPELQSSSCGNPGVPPKGILYGTRFNVGDKIRYSCVSGYVLDGHPQLTCVTNAGNAAVWDFPVPICRGKHWALHSYCDCCMMGCTVYTAFVSLICEYMCFCQWRTVLCDSRALTMLMFICSTECILSTVERLRYEVIWVLMLSTYFSTSLYTKRSKYPLFR